MSDELKQAISSLDEWKEYRKGTKQKGEVLARICKIIGFDFVDLSLAYLLRVFDLYFDIYDNYLLNRNNKKEAQLELQQAMACLSMLTKRVTESRLSFQAKSDQTIHDFVYAGENTTATFEPEVFEEKTTGIDHYTLAYISAGEETPSSIAYRTAIKTVFTLWKVQHPVIYKRLIGNGGGFVVDILSEIAHYYTHKDVKWLCETTGINEPFLWLQWVLVLNRYIKTGERWPEPMLLNSFIVSPTNNTNGFHNTITLSVDASNCSVTDTTNKIKAVLQKALPEGKTSGKPFEPEKSVPVFVIANIHKNSTKRWKETWSWMKKAHFFTDEETKVYDTYSSMVGKTLKLRYESAKRFFSKD